MYEDTRRPRDDSQDERRVINAPIPLVSPASSSFVRFGSGCDVGLDDNDAAFLFSDSSLFSLIW